jgi:hypothetical protein
MRQFGNVLGPADVAGYPVSTLILTVPQLIQIQSGVPTKKFVHIEIIAFTVSRPVAFPSHVESALFSARLFPSSPHCKQRFLLSDIAKTQNGKFDENLRCR